MFSLPKKKVIVKPVMWDNWLPKGHSGSWLNDGAIMRISVPENRSTGYLVNPLTPEEVEFFEDRTKSGMDFLPGDLNPYRKPDYKKGEEPFWYRKDVVIRKSDTIVNEDTVLLRLDLGIPEQYLEYKILMANCGPGGVVAKDWDSRYDQGSHKIVIVDENYESEVASSTAQDKIDAYKEFDKIAKSQTKLYEFLSVYWLENQNAVKPSVDSKVPFMVAQVEKIISKDTKRFLSVVKTDYESKLMIHKGILAGVLRLIGNTFVMMPEETVIGSSLRDAILYFNDARNQENRLKLVAQIEAYKG